ncbi:MAG: family 43 glycosylhydrolase [Chitinispirillaceae bacterium]|nr:family 43 glycosylhydrolase [Chitinispirillaceae bacterium]
MVDKYYYSLSSSFGWQPGLPIMRSSDLLHWDYIGYAYLSNSNIATGTTSGGAWGSEIGYNPHSKAFLCYTPINNRIVAYASDKPEGPYAGPSDIGIEAIDPGFFADDDGRLYLIVASGEIWELEQSGLSIQGTSPVAGGLNPGGLFEGPEIVKRNGYYYVLYSPGGTCMDEYSAISCLRAQQIAGPWTANPNNPLMSAPSSSNAEIQGPAHGELLQMPDDKWFMTFHAFDQNHVSLGRFMCMEPIEWTTDNWFRPKNGRIPWTRPQAAPDLPVSTVQTTRSDEFSGTTLGNQWFFHTRPDTSGASWSLRDRPGFMRIKTKGGDVGETSSLTNVFLQRIDLKRFEASAKVEFDATSAGEAAGILLYKDPMAHIELATTVRGGVTCFTVTKNGVSTTPVATAPNTIGTTVFLKLSVDGNENATFFYGPNDTDWTALGSAINFGKNGSPYIGWKCHEWSAGTIGFFAVHSSGAASKTADFDWFRYGDPAQVSVSPGTGNRRRSDKPGDVFRMVNQEKFFSTGTLCFVAPSASKVTITLHTILGRTVTIVSCMAREGMNSVEVGEAVRHCSKGLHVVSFSVNGRTRSVERFVH